MTLRPSEWRRNKKAHWLPRVRPSRMRCKQDKLLLPLLCRSNPRRGSENLISCLQGQFELKGPPPGALSLPDGAVLSLPPSPPFTRSVHYRSPSSSVFLPRAFNHSCGSLLSVQSAPEVSWVWNRSSEVSGTHSVRQ